MPDVISLLEITKASLHLLDDYEDLLQRYSDQFHLYSNETSEVYRKHVHSDAESTWLFDIKTMLLVEDKELKHFFLIKLNNEIIGFVCLYVASFMIDTVILNSFFIAPKFRGQGFGSVVLEEIFSFIRREGKFKHIILNVLAENDAAIALYRKFGFKNHEVIMFKENL